MRRDTSSGRGGGAAPGGAASRDTAAGAAHQAALFDLFLATSPVGFALLDREFRYLVINDVLAEGHGLSIEQHLGRTVAEIAPRAWSNLHDVYHRVLAGETVANLSLTERQVSESEERRRWLASYYPLRVDAEIVGVGIVANEVTDLLDTQRALEDRTRLYAMLASANRAVSLSTSAAELFASVCRIAVEVGGFALAWIGVPHDGEVDVATHYGASAYLTDLHVSLDPADPDSAGPTGRAFAFGKPQVINDFLAAEMTAPWHRRAAEFGFRSSAALPIREGGAVVATLGLYSDQVGYFTPDLVETLSEITPILSVALDHFADERVREADEARLRTHDRALRAISQGVLITDTAPGRHVVYASPSFLALTGYDEDEIVGRNPDFLNGPETDRQAIAIIERAITEEREATVELVNYRKDGTPFWNRLTITPVLDDHGRATHFVGVNTDVTAARELEQQLLQSQKLEALGTLAGGIAHDFNNMLLVIRGYTGLLAQRLEDQELLGMTERIDAAVSRAAEFTRRLLTFSRGQVINPRAMDLNDVVRDTLHLLERMIGEDIVVTVDLAPGLPPVVVDRGQAEQVILNLITNAREAMPAGGTLTVRTFVTEVDADFAERHPALAPGPHVTFEISDSGVGMDPETQHRLFEPFYTTKASGTGLGLSTVYGIVRRCDGHIAFTSHVARGTTFTIYLPAADAPAPAPSWPARARSALAGRETVLVVEDVAEARALICRYLAELGYDVLEAVDGADALEVVAPLARPLDVLVTDVVMPHMDGRELARRLLEGRPDLGIVFTSGYAADLARDLAGDRPAGGRSVFLDKPYTLDELGRAVRDLLDRAPGAG